MLAQALLTAIVNGNLINDFSAAGKRMEHDNEAGEEYINAYGAAMANEDNEELQMRLDKLEPKVAQTMDYETCKEYGDKQAAMLRALDFVDAFGQGLRLYNVCRAKTRYDEKTSMQCSCGLAFPSKMWTQPDPGRWKFTCNVNWNALVNEQKQWPDDTLLKVWVDDMNKDTETRRIGLR